MKRIQKASLLVLVLVLCVGTEGCKLGDYLKKLFSSSTVTVGGGGQPNPQQPNPQQQQPNPQQPNTQTGVVTGLGTGTNTGATNVPSTRSFCEQVADQLKRADMCKAMGADLLGGVNRTRGKFIAKLGEPTKGRALHARLQALSDRVRTLQGETAPAADGSIIAAKNALYNLSTVCASVTQDQLPARLQQLAQFTAMVDRAKATLVGANPQLNRRATPSNPNPAPYPAAETEALPLFVKDVVADESAASTGGLMLEGMLRDYAQLRLDFENAFPQGPITTTNTPINTTITPR